MRFNIFLGKRKVTYPTEIIKVLFACANFRFS